MSQKADDGRALDELAHGRRLGGAQEVAPREDAEDVAGPVEDGEALVARALGARVHPGAHLARRAVGRQGHELPGRALAHEHLVEQIGRYGEKTGTDHILLRVQWPGLGQKIAVRSLERLGRVVEQLN